MNSVAFRVFVRKLDQATFACRFRVNVGRGTLGLRAFGRPDPGPSVQHEEDELAFEYIRASRFVHILPNGERHSYSFARLPDAEAARHLPENWVELVASTQSGFRYLLYVEEDLTPTAKEQEDDEAEAVQVVQGTSFLEGLPDGETLDHLEKLTLEEALEMLKAQAARVVDLQARLTLLNGKLQESGQREDELLALLAGWRERSGS